MSTKPPTANDFFTLGGLSEHPITALKRVIVWRDETLAELGCVTLDEPILVSFEEKEQLVAAGIPEISQENVGDVYEHCDTCLREKFCTNCGTCDHFYTDTCQVIEGLETFNPNTVYVAGDVVWAYDGVGYSRWVLTENAITFNIHPSACVDWAILCSCECDYNEGEKSTICITYE